MGSHRSMAVVPVARVLDSRLTAVDLRVALWLVVQVDRGDTDPVSLDRIADDLTLDHAAAVRVSLERLRRVGVLYLLDMTDPSALQIGFDYEVWEARS